MAPSRKGRREKPVVPPESETLVTLKVSMDLLRDIIARTDHRTLLRCAATCKLLRREILTSPPSSDPHVTRTAPFILAYLCADAKKPLSLVHPTTPAASAFCHNQLARFMSRNKAVGTLLGGYKPMSSRRGLVVLRRTDIEKEKRPKSGRWSELCVYDPMSGARTFFSDPTEILEDRGYDPKYVLLTAADGIDDSFLLLVFDFHKASMRVHTVTASSCGTWESVSCASRLWCSLKKRGDPAVLSGGLVHWLLRSNKQILSYDLGTGKAAGLVKVPTTGYNDYQHGNQLYLATSSDGKLLRLFAIEGLMMFVWLHLPASATCDSGWSQEAAIDMKEALRTLDPHIIAGPGETRIEFEGSGKRTGEVVLLVVVRRQNYRDIYDDELIVFDLETKKMYKQKQGFSLLEIDLPSRLQTMKMFQSYS